MENFKQSPAFEAATARAQWTKYLLTAGIVVSGMSIVTCRLEIQKLSGAPDGITLDEFNEANVGLLDFARLGVGLVTIIVSLTTILLFLMRIHRAHRNLRPLGAKGLPYSPGWAVGAWFIPFANLFIPFRITKELWTKSDPEAAEFGLLNSDSTVSSFFGVWWGFWVASNIVTNAATRLSFRADTIAQELGATWLNLLAGVLSILATIFARRVISAIDAQQNSASKRLPQSLYPLPPVYGTSSS